jgi:CheY-like chemotaxis protein
MTAGYITDELRAAAPEAGIVQLIHKPDTVEELCATVQRLVGESTQEPSHGG